MRRLAPILSGLLLLFRAVSAAEPTNAPAPPRPARDDAAVAIEYERLLEADDAAHEEVDEWIRADSTNRTSAAGADVTLKARVKQRLEPVRKSYEEFLARHPEHSKARLAFGSYLMEIGEVDEAVRHMEKARELDPKDPAAWNNLANHYGHTGSAEKAFEYYARAIALNPKEPVYYQNLATTVFLYRADATNFFKCDEQQVFQRSLDLYRQAVRLDPTNFVLAADYAMTFYGVYPPAGLDPAAKEAARQKINDEALSAWKTALRVAPDEIEREGVHIHLARVEISRGRFAEAREHLDQVSDATFDSLKKRLSENLERRQNPTSTNSPAATAPIVSNAPAPTTIPVTNAPAQTGD